MALSVMLAGCSAPYDKAPNEYSKIRWETQDYSFYFTPDNDCRGIYKYGDKTYNVQVSFDGGRVSVLDVDGENEMFFGVWSYEENERLCISGIEFNTKDYKEFEDNLSGIIRLKKAKV